MIESSPPKYFTRHLLRAGLQCATKLYYKANNWPEDQRITPFLEHAGFNKYYLKKLAGLDYPEAVLVAEKSKEKAAQKTAALLRNENIVIQEAAFLHQSYYAKVAVLIKRGQEITLCDVQTKAFNPRRHTIVNQHGKLLKKWKRYIVDLAYKYFVIRQAYPHRQYQMQLMLPDKTQSAMQDLLLPRLKKNDTDLQQEALLYRLDVTEYVKEVSSGYPFEGSQKHKQFEEVLAELQQLYLHPQWQVPCIGKKCNRCEFRTGHVNEDEAVADGFERCWSASEQVPQYTPVAAPVFDLIGPGLKKWVQRGIYLQKNIPLGDLPALKSLQTTGKPITQQQRQSLQVRKLKGKKPPPEIIKPPLFDEINRWEYPLHFLDFEAGNYAVPIRSGRKPYALVVFQYSCHSLHADGSWSHRQWIADPGDGYPNYALIRQLMKIPDMERGTIVQYSKFEHHALKSIRKELKQEIEKVDGAPERIDWLNQIVERCDSNHPRGPYLADMSRLVKNYYYNTFMNGSLSIKDVLTSVLTVSKSLKNTYAEPYKSSNHDAIIWWQKQGKDEVKNPYDILRASQGNREVGHGTEAMVTYGKLLTNTISSSKKEEVYDALFTYCELDTLAMMMIFEHWKSCS